MVLKWFATPSPFGLIPSAPRRSLPVALTPSMIPRPSVLQGVECGLAFALLYGLGTGASALWSWLQLPVAGAGNRRTFGWVSILLCVALVAYGLVREPDWQNAIRRAMGMPPVATTPSFPHRNSERPGRPVSLIGIARFFNAFGDAHFGLVWPRSSLVASRLLGGFGIAAVLFWSIGSGLSCWRTWPFTDSLIVRIAASMRCCPPSFRHPWIPWRPAATNPSFPWASLGAQGTRARGRGPIQE